MARWNSSNSTTSDARSWPTSKNSKSATETGACTERSQNGNRQKTRNSLGPLRLGQLRLRHHGNGRLFPDILQRVLEHRHQPRAEHLPTRPGQLARQFGRRTAGPLAGSYRRPGRYPAQIPLLVRLSRYPRHRRPLYSCRRPLGAGDLRLRFGGSGLLGSQHLLRRPTSRGGGPRSRRLYLRAGLQSGLSGRRPAFRD